MKRIAQIITSLEIGGTLGDIVRLCESGQDTDSMSILIYGRSSKQLSGFKCQAFEISELGRNIHLINDFISFVRLLSLLHTLKPDIVHTHSSKAGFLGRWAAFTLKLFSRQFKNLKIIHTPHGHIFYGYEFGRLKTRFFILLEKITALVTDVLIALTEGEKRESLAYGIGKPSQWKIINSGVNIKDNIYDKNLSRKFMGIPENSIVIGVVARLEFVKGIMYFIRAAQNILESYEGMEKDRLLFMIAGGGSLMAGFENLVKEEELEDKIVLLGHLQNPDEFMSTLDIYVQPSLNEGMGKTLVQAQAFGLPVIATRVQGIPDTVVEGKTALLIPPAAGKALAEAMIELIKDPLKRKTLGENGRSWVNENVDGFKRFSFERMLKLHKDIYYEGGIKP
jgi:glycosyltransferase involved in cell wall biosynthesis